MAPTPTLDRNESGVKENLGEAGDVSTLMTQGLGLEDAQNTDLAHDLSFMEQASYPDSPMRQVITSQLNVVPKPVL